MVRNPHEIVFLPWDSKFFGYKVGKIVLPHDCESSTAISFAESVKVAARAEGYNLVYAFCSPKLIQANLRFLQELGYRPVNGKRDYLKKLNSSSGIGELGVCQIEECHQLSESLLKLGFQSGSLSRFKTDPEFIHNEFERLYAEWVSQSVRDISKITTFVFGNREAPSGFITVERNGKAFRIGLLSVDQNSRRLGVGRLLVSYVERWAWQKGCETLSVATQPENHVACSFYEKCGFHMVSEVSIFHLWL